MGTRSDLALVHYAFHTLQREVGSNSLVPHPFGNNHFDQYFAESAFKTMVLPHLSRCQNPAHILLQSHCCDIFVGNTQCIELLGAGIKPIKLLSKYFGGISSQEKDQAFPQNRQH